MLIHRFWAIFFSLSYYEQKGFIFDHCNIRAIIVKEREKEMNYCTEEEIQVAIDGRYRG